MSAHPYTFASTLDTGNPARQLVLYVIASHVNVEDGTTYVGIRTLMEEAKIRSDRTMRNHIAQLIEDGFLEKSPRTRRNGANTSCLLRLVGFLEWKAGNFGVPKRARVVEAAAKITGGSEGDEEAARITGAPGNLSTAGPGNLSTGANVLNTDSNNESNLDARERAQEDSIDDLEVKAAPPAPSASHPTGSERRAPRLDLSASSATHRIRPCDPQWKSWLDWLPSPERTMAMLSELIEASPSRWPGAQTHYRVVPPPPSGLSAKSLAIIG